MSNKTLIALACVFLGCSVACHRSSEENGNAKVAEAKRPGSVSTKINSDDEIFQKYNEVYSSSYEKFKIMGSELSPGTYDAVKVGVKIRNLIKAKDSPNKIGDENNSVKFFSQNSVSDKGEKSKLLVIRSDSGPQDIAEVKALLPHQLVVTKDPAGKITVSYAFAQVTASRKAPEKSEKTAPTESRVKLNLKTKPEDLLTSSHELSEADLKNPVEVGAFLDLSKIGPTGTLRMTKHDADPANKINYVTKIETDSAEIFVMTVLIKQQIEKPIKD